MGSTENVPQPPVVEKSFVVTLGDYDLKPQWISKQKLSPLDMNMPRLYGSRWILCFPLAVAIDKAKVFETLKESLAHTIASIPWIAGDVGPEDGSDPKDDRIQVIEGKGGVEFRYRNLSGVLPSYKQLKKDNFSFSTLTTPLISPLQIVQESQPVFAAQANFIEGGLLLTAGVHHSVCDAAGLDFILETWALNTSAASGSQSFSSYDPVSNERAQLSEGLPADNITDFPEYVIMPTLPSDSVQLAPPTSQMPPMSAKIFYFSPERLTELKLAAKSYSTHDAVCGFFWHHMTLARNPSNAGGEGGKTSAVLFAVNIRGHTSPPLPQTYLGNALFGGITPRLPIVVLKDPKSGLAHASAALRNGLKSIRKPSRVPLTIGLLSSRPNPQDFKFAARGFLGPDITATSWVDVGVREREWGILGKPEGFRVPYEAADGSINIFPALANGGLEVMSGLESVAMERMLGNPEFQKFAQQYEMK